jgi:hypothetical protein
MHVTSNERTLFSSSELLTKFSNMVSHKGQNTKGDFIELLILCDVRSLYYFAVKVLHLSKNIIIPIQLNKKL